MKESLQNPWLKSLVHDRQPGITISLWRHFYDKEFSLPSYIHTMARFYEAFRWDFLKLNPRSSYHNEAWGVKYQPSNSPEVKPTLEFTPIQQMADWVKVIRPISPDQGPFGEQLEAIREIRRMLGDNVVIIQTLFSPLEVLSRFLPNKYDLAAFLRHEFSMFQDLSNIVTDVLTTYALLCLEAGADGFYFATTWGTRKSSDAIFNTFERPYDLRLLQAVREKSKFLVLHLCGSEPRVQEILDYPVDVLHWNWLEPTNIRFFDIERTDSRVLSGGILATGILQYGPPYRIYDYVERAVHPQRWIVSTECTYPPMTPEEHVWALRKAVADLRGETWP